VNSFKLPAVPLFMAAALFTGSLLTGAAAPASAAPASAARPALPVPSVSGNGPAYAAVTTALRRVGWSEGRFTLKDRAGLSGRALSAGNALVTDLNKLGRQPGARSLAGDNVVDTADHASAAGQDTVITIVPGTTLTISSTEVELQVSATDVTDIENAASLGTAIASLVGDILAVAGVPGGSQIAAIVGAALTVGSDALKLCAGNDGGALVLSVSIPSGELPSVSACGISI
jgi:hypothetical protein